MKTLNDYILQIVYSELIHDNYYRTDIDLLQEAEEKTQRILINLAKELVDKEG